MDGDDPEAGERSRVESSAVGGAGAPGEAEPGRNDLPARPAGLHPRIRLVWVGWTAIASLLLGLAVTGLERALLGTLPWLGPAVLTVVFGAGTAHAFARYRIWRYRLREESLYLDRGVLTRVRTVVPYVRIQHVDVRRSALARMLGLSTIVVYTAGSRGADVVVPGLPRERAADLQHRLQRLATDADGTDAV